MDVNDFIASYNGEVVMGDIHKIKWSDSSTECKEQMKMWSLECVDGAD